ncbi:MAG: hypothetical protein U0Q16_25400 [Bryobacteraceae bacterium]
MRLRDLMFAAALAIAVAATLGAAPPLSTVRDTIYKADGTRFTGTVIIEWRSFDASDTSFIGRERIQFSVTDGFLNVKLVPTTDAQSTAWYRVRYLSGLYQFTEAWAVKPSDTPLRVSQVRVADPLLGPGSGGSSGNGSTIEITDVQGLQAELDLRPKQGIGYGPSRAAIINAAGDLEGATGDPAECVRVDGSSGPCGAAGGGSAVTGTFVDGETPAGAVNGTNATFSLSASPSPAASLYLYRNGVLQKRFVDFDLTGNSIQFVTAAIPQSGDLLVASYRTAGTGGTLPQVLCTSAGSGTSVTSATSLGTCTLAADTLRAGDRLELLYDYTHEGTGTGFAVDVRVAGTAVGSQTAAASVTLATGRTSLGIHGLGLVWSTQTWGAGLAMASSAGTASPVFTNSITIDFRGSMTASTSDTVTLRNFTVVRYPAP